MRVEIHVAQVRGTPKDSLRRNTHGILSVSHRFVAESRDIMALVHGEEGDQKGGGGECTHYESWGILFPIGLYLTLVLLIVICMM